METNTTPSKASEEKIKNNNYFEKLFDEFYNVLKKLKCEDVELLLEGIYLNFPEKIEKIDNKLVVTSNFKEIFKTYMDLNKIIQNNLFKDNITAIRFYEIFKIKNNKSNDAMIYLIKSYFKYITKKK